MIVEATFFKGVPQLSELNERMMWAKEVKDWPNERMMWAQWGEPIGAE